MKLVAVAILGALLYFGFTEVQPVIASLTSADTTNIVPLDKHKKESLVVASLLGQYHYRKTTLNDSLSSVIFDDYILSLDHNKSYFLKSDIDYFEKYRYELDNGLQTGDVEVPFQIFRIYRERLYERIENIFALLESEIDFTQDEFYEVNNDNQEWATTREELDDHWRKIIKSQALSLKLGGKDWDGIKETLYNRYERYGKYISKYKSDDVFQIFMNSFSETFDPHTNYFSPKTSEDFKINMSLSLEGIGARLNNPDDYVTIVEIVPGGPAAKSKQLFKDDRIIGVAQADEEFVDIFGWRTEDAVELIRGAKGTTVRLQILPGDAPIASEPKVVSLVREKIKLEDQSAKKQIVPITKNNETYRLGIIKIPSFYIDFEAAQKGDPNYKSTTRDVKKLVQELNDEGVDGIMIDLRYNGGGSLQEATELTGLFIPQGPVVQVRDTKGQVDVERDRDRAVYYDGPLAVMVNRFSASASEIFSGAIQDYKRGLIIGETTYGKGSVQQLVNLDQFLNGGDEKLGQLKLTLAKYYRITGSSTQNIGVTPDIEFPSFVDTEQYGEGSLPSALPWDQIKSTYYNASNYVSPEMVANLKELFKDRLRTDAQLKDYINEQQEAQKIRNREKISLNYEKRKQELDELEARRKDRKSDDLSTTIDSSEVDNDDDEKEALERDVLLKEGLMLLAELANEKVKQ
ncbi:MAG: carboxy terminal-processing peptidase [Cyclobacteriaceae bacterium]